MSSSLANDGTYAWQAREATLARLDALSRLFDIAFEIPGTNVRFGVEAILRLVPVRRRRGVVPYVGDAFNVAFRANRRNVRLLRDYFDGCA